MSNANLNVTICTLGQNTTRHGGGLSDTPAAMRGERRATHAWYAVRHAAAAVASGAHRRGGWTHTLRMHLKDKVGIWVGGRLLGPSMHAGKK